MTARYTECYRNLQVRLKEIDLLLGFATAKQRKAPVSSGNEVKALCRGAIVLLCAHLEAYVKELGELALESLHGNNVSREYIASQFFFHLSKDFIQDIRETSDPEKSAEKIFSFLNEEADLWSRGTPFPRPVPVEKFNKGFSNPGFNKIKGYFGRFGYKEFSSEFNLRLRFNSQAVKNAVTHLVDVRNKIAHGDQNETKTPAEIRVLVSEIRVFCKCTDFLFSSWWRKNFCPIR